MTWIDGHIKRLMPCTCAQLQAEYQTVWGEPTRSNNRDYLIKRIVSRLQVQHEGGLSHRARERAAAIACDQDIRVRPKPEVHAAFANIQREGTEVTRTMPPIGSMLVREYKGRRLEVLVQQDGFSFEGKQYSSLTQVARIATGSNWNGRLFFHLSKRGSR